MKSLLPPTLAVIFSTAGVALGCHAAGMPPRDVALATTLAFAAAFTAAFGAALLAGRSRPLRRNPAP